MEEAHGGLLGPTHTMRTEHNGMRTPLTAADGARPVTQKFSAALETLCLMTLQHTQKKACFTRWRMLCRPARPAICCRLREAASGYGSRMSEACLDALARSAAALRAHRCGVGDAAQARRCAS
jgi:hypothetical protein